MCNKCTFHTRTPEQRFWSQADPCRTDGCVIWLGSTRGGYGRFFLNGHHISAHHFLAGRPPKGLQADHVKLRGCTNKSCVWPEHLEFVSQSENLRRADMSQTYCERGHEFIPSNIYWRVTSAGLPRRNCRECRRIQRRAYRQTPKGRERHRLEESSAKHRRQLNPSP